MLWHRTDMGHLGRTGHFYQCPNGHPYVKEEVCY